jgi:phytoene dehydrogenase-like protein
MLLRQKSSAQPLPDEVDGVFVGGGHNSLVAAAYLARCGLDVLILEANDKLGGGVTTEEITLPQFRHNLHAFFVRWTADYTIWNDLDLDRYGVQAIFPEVQNAVPYDDGRRALLNYRDVDRSIAAIKALNSDDAGIYRQVYAEFSEIVDRIEGPLRFAAPLPVDEFRDRLGRSALGRRYLQLADRSAIDIIADAFTAEPLRALVGFNVAVRGYLPVIDEPGTGYCAVLALVNSHQGRMIRGGSYEMARALYAAAYAGGARAVNRSRVAAIEVRDGRAVAVETDDGRRVRARRFVASNVPANQTLLDLVGAAHLDTSLVTAMREHRGLEEGLFGVHFALERPPQFAAVAEQPELLTSLNFALGYESLDDLRGDQQAINERRVPEHTGLHSSFPTVNDPSQAPPGGHTTFAWQFVAGREPDGSDRVWQPADNDRQVRAVIDCYGRYAPDFEDCVLAVAAHSPTDTGAQLTSMPRGDRHHGSFHPDNWGAQRPHPALSAYRTPIAGLYLCGSSQHPGGSFTGNPGFNAAGAIADDLGLPVWWPRRDAVAVLDALD